MRAITCLYIVLLTACETHGPPDGQLPQDTIQSMDTVPALPWCDAPYAAAMTYVALGDSLPLTGPPGIAIQLQLVANGMPAKEEDWAAGDSVTFEEPGLWTLYARLADPVDCAPNHFTHTFNVSDVFSPAADQPDSAAVSKDAEFLGWVKAAEVQFGDGVVDKWKTSSQAHGPATAGAYDVVSLGEGGVATLTFNVPIVDGDGPDFAVFENSFSHRFLELAFVEVSSDGEQFVRFPSVYLGVGPVGDYGEQETALIDGLAGKYKVGFGTPFDLAVLAGHPALSGPVVAVRIVDIIGDGRSVDSFGRPIYDPYPTVDSAGFDLQAVGVLNAQ